MNNIIHGSLFSGIGGFDLAAKWAGWRNAFNCEINEFCRKILKYHFPNAEQYKDITKTDFSKWNGQIDVLSGGFPCQPFSVAGKRKGTDDNRYLWTEMLRVIHEIQPTWVVGENVAGIVSMVQPGKSIKVANEHAIFGEDYRERVLLRQQYIVEKICEDIEREGYSVQPIIIPACAVGAPHRRDRVWFIANREDAKFKGMQRKLEDNILSGRDAPDTDSYRWRDGKNQQVTIAERKGTSNIGTLREDGTSSHTEIAGLPPRHERQSQEKSRRRNERVGIPQDWSDFPTQSPVCGRNDGLSNKLDSISFSKWRTESIKAYGNAIVPQVAYEIFKAIDEFYK